MYHLKNMAEDQYDYYAFSIRRFTLQTFEGLMKFNDNELYQYKPVIKATNSLIRLAIRVDKIKEEEIKKFEPLHEAYMKSEKYE